VYGIILINSQGHVLLVRGRKEGKWSFPKGHKKRGESDIQCALRELAEETGILLSPTFQQPTYHKLAKAGYFLYTVDDSCYACVNDPQEIEEVAWWPVLDLPLCNSNVDVSLFRNHMQSATRGTPSSLEVSTAMSRPRIRPLARSNPRPTPVPLYQDTTEQLSQGPMFD
jgi:ADP-ribose pyrophosphatase YjhB (NUDIX family)